MPSLQVKQLSKTRAYDDIFANVSFSLEQGELLWLKGANGSGKTTLMRILAGLSQASSGDFVLDGLSRHYVSHQLNLIDSLSVQESVEQLFPLYGIDGVTTGRIDEALATVGLTGIETLRVSQLSAGQKQRLNLLLLVLDKRPLWLLDEPYSNLDKDGRVWLNNLLTEHLENNGMAIVISHADSLGVDATQILNLDDVVAEVNDA